MPRSRFRSRDDPGPVEDRSSFAIVLPELSRTSQVDATNPSNFLKLSSSSFRSSGKRPRGDPRTTVGNRPQRGLPAAIGAASRRNTEGRNRLPRRHELHPLPALGEPSGRCGMAASSLRRDGEFAGDRNGLWWPRRPALRVREDDTSTVDPGNCYAGAIASCNTAGSGQPPADRRRRDRDEVAGPVGLFGLGIDFQDRG